MTLVQQAELGGDIPQFVIKKLVSSSLAIVRRAVDKFQRKAEVVDSEIRAEFIANIPSANNGVMPLTSTQQLTVEKCMNLEKDFTSNNGYEIKKLKSKSFFVDMSMKMNTTALSHPVATGKVSAIIDTSPAEYIASIWDHCGNLKMRLHKEEKHFARLVVDTISINEQVVATIKHVKRPLSDREFVVRLIWWMADVDTYFLALVDEGNMVVDYGSKLKRVVRGEVYGLHIVKSFGGKEGGIVRQCEVTSYQILGGGGYLPRFVVDSKLPKTLNFLLSARNMFSRDEEIDLEEREKLIEIMTTGNEGYKTNERNIINGAVFKFGKLETESLKVVDSPDPLVMMKSGFIVGEGNIIGFAVTEVDASIEECAGWDYIPDSREKMGIFAKNGGLERVITKVNNHSQINRTVYDLTGISYINPREWLAKTVWQWDNATQDKLIIATVPLIDEALGPSSNTGFVRATMNNLLSFKKLEAVGNTPRTEITYWAQVNLGGHIPKKFVNSQVSANLMHLSEMRTRFDKSLEIDALNRQTFIKRILERERKRKGKSDDDYSDGEKIQIDASVASLVAFDKLSEKKKVVTRSPLASSTIGRNPKERIGRGQSKIVVRANIDQVLAFMWHTDSRARTSGSNNLEKEVYEMSLYCNIVYFCKKQTDLGVVKFLPRDSLLSVVWKRIGSTVIMSGIPTIHPDRIDRTDRVRGEFPFTIKLEQLSDDSCRFTHNFSLDMKVGNAPTLFIDWYIAKNLQITETVQQYFQQLRPLNLLDVDDGKAMAEALMLPYSKKEKQEAKDSKHGIADIRVHSVFSSHVALKQYGGENPFFEGLMLGVVSNNLRLSGAVNSRLLTLSKKEGRTIGNGLASILMGSTSPDLAVEEWILTFPATQELDKNLIWFRPMMNRCAMRLLAKVAWGAKFRLYTGAALSIMDLATDITTIYRFFNKGKYGYAYANVAFIGVTLFLQWLTIFHQNRKRGLKVIAYESLILLSVTKPAVDAMRVASGEAQPENSVMDPQMELTFTKTIEMFAESIPSSVLQVHALLGSDEFSKQAVFSILVSASAIAFASTTISVDFDTDPVKRKNSPSFY